MNWLITFTLVLLAAAVVDCQGRRGRGRQHQRCKVDLKNDQYSPFYWKGYENICTKNICEQYPWLPCDVARTTIMEIAAGHRDHDIIQEIEDLRKYYKTMIPKPDNTLPYNCEGACQENTRPLQLERVFFDKLMFSEETYEMQDRWLCTVIGPEIHYQTCGGPCNMRFGGGGGTNYCVPDLVVTMDIWIYCPNATQLCHKTTIDIPQSCSCKRVSCKQDHPRPEPFLPKLPPQPLDPWAFDEMGMELGHANLNPVGADVGAHGGVGGAHGGVGGAHGVDSVHGGIALGGSGAHGGGAHGGVSAHGGGAHGGPH